MTHTQQLATTPLHDWHVAHNARMVDFAGWAMPVQYTSIVAEHQATRTHASLFDISHMGRIAVRGEGATTFLDRLLTRKISDLRPGRIRYSLMCDETGGSLDDVLIGREPDPDNVEEALPLWNLVVNASNRPKILQWLSDQRSELCSEDPSLQVEWNDLTETTAMLALQGPVSAKILTQLSPDAPSKMKYFTGKRATIAGHEVYVSRTGYTGEDGYEISCPAAAASSLWQSILDTPTVSQEQGEKVSATPAGLGARDTLRLEAAMPLYGHELSPEIGPIQAGLEMSVTLEDREFIGKQAIESALHDASLPVRIGLYLDSRRVAREGAALFAGGHRCGIVTSGTFSPTLQRTIAMAYVDRVVAEETAGTDQFEVDIRGQRVAAERVPLPFYRRSKP